MINSKYKELEEAFNRAFDRLPKNFAEEYLESPASARYHQNYAGGLIEHCVMMGEALYSRSKERGGTVDLTADECARIALYHDLCKVGLYKFSGGKYAANKEMYQHHALLSVQRCEKFGILLTQKERICILLHMAGAWWNQEDVDALTDDDRDWIAKNFDIVAAVQWADMKGC